MTAVDRWYFPRLCIVCEFIDAGFDVVDAEAMADDELRRRQIADDMFDSKTIHAESWSEK
jgi:hypothetical protein